MLLCFNNSFSDAYDEDKKMEVTVENDTLVFKIKKKGKTSSFYLQTDKDWACLNHYVRFHLGVKDTSSSYAYRKKGFGICLLNYKGEIEHEHQPDLPDLGIDSYDYDKLSALFNKEGVIYALFEMYEGVGEETVRKIIQYCVVSQAKFVYTGEPVTAHKLTLKDVSKKLGVDLASVSRCTRHVRIYSPCGKIFTLDNKGLNLDQPSLFDEGIRGNGNITRLEVLYQIKCIREDEGTDKPLTDEEICERLHQRGYKIQRRTVTKYRNILNENQNK